MHVPRSTCGCVDVPKGPQVVGATSSDSRVPPAAAALPTWVTLLDWGSRISLFPHLPTSFPFPLPTAPASCRGAFPICTRAARINGFCVGVSSGTTEGPDPTSEGYEIKRRAGSGPGLGKGRSHPSPCTYDGFSKGLGDR